MEGDSETLLSLFPTSVEKTLTFTGSDAEEIDGWIEDRTNGLSVIKDAKAELEAIEAKLKQKLGEAEKGETGKYNFSWRTQSRKEFIVKATSFRVLTTKQKKEAV